MKIFTTLIKLEKNLGFNMKIFQSYKKVFFEEYINFSGRATISEFWYFVLVNILLAFITYQLDNLFNLNFDDGAGGIFYLLLILITFIPGIAVSVRRLHDQNKSGWSLLIWFIPLIGPFWILILFTSPGTIGKNKYGYNSLYPKNEISEIGIE